MQIRQIVPNGETCHLDLKTCPDSQSLKLQTPECVTYSTYSTFSQVPVPVPSTTRLETTTILCQKANRYLSFSKQMPLNFRLQVQKLRHTTYDSRMWQLGSAAVGRWTRDEEVAGSTPTAAVFGQQLWASCSHLMCLCSPSSITWYLARAFMLKAPYCGSGIGSNEQGGIVERFCGDSRIA